MMELAPWSLFLYSNLSWAKSSDRVALIQIKTHYFHQCPLRPTPLHWFAINLHSFSEFKRKNLLEEKIYIGILISSSLTYSLNFVYSFHLYISFECLIIYIYWIIHLCSLLSSAIVRKELVLLDNLRNWFSYLWKLHLDHICICRHSLLAVWSRSSFFNELCW